MGSAGLHLLACTAACASEVASRARFERSAEESSGRAFQKKGASKWPHRDLLGTCIVLVHAVVEGIQKGVGRLS